MKKDLAMFFAVAMCVMVPFTVSAQSMPSHDDILRQEISLLMQEVQQLLIELQGLANTQASINTQLQTVAPSVPQTQTPMIFGSIGPMSISMSIDGDTTDATTTASSIGGRCGGVRIGAFVTYNQNMPHVVPNALTITYPDGTVHATEGTTDLTSPLGQNEVSASLFYTPTIQSGTEKFLLQAGNIEKEIDVTVIPPQFVDGQIVSNGGRTDGYNFTVLNTGDYFSTTTNSCK